VLSAQVRTMLKGYGNHATQLGYQKKGAVPLTEVEMQLLLQSMHKTCNSSSRDPHQHMLPLRDGMLFSLLWQSCLRGFNAGALRLDNVVLPTGENAVPYLVPELRLQAGAVLHLLVPDSCPHHAAACRPITNYVTRPLGVETKRFAEKPMTCSNP